jgi:hypothetical protein
MIAVLTNSDPDAFPAETLREGGSAAGFVRWTLRLEGAVALALSVALYAHGGFSWVWFGVLFLSPDLAMAGYFAGPRVGAFAYNFVHTYALALPLAAFGLLAGQPVALALGLIWTAHIGLDRALGYGLKYASRFGHTHLNLFGGG